ncbi:peptide-methionine (S)-S-oxide reductase MsrA [Candidatus Palauibacter sp.]|uniref:peptide-methionine (S)-S-oxide reductase MsrA n=1 Tax=Candidatus Palauibacter sp. TaxID=3101350 RepID=UPI003C6EE3C1
MSERTETATLAGGCFWCLEAVYQLLEGVHGVKSGYAGGQVENPTYQQVCTGRTGHAEVVRVSFDPDTITFDDLLDVFFTIHDPTTLNRQGGDIGTQYRSAIFHENEAERDAAERKVSEINAAGIWRDPIVTEIASLGEFYPAEPYHDDFLRQNPTQPYCRAVVEPKVAKFRRQHLQRLKREAGV